MVVKTMDDLIYASVTELAQAIRSKEVSSVEVVKACLDRIEAVNPRLNAVVELTAEAALKQADEADQALAREGVKGPLHGVPMTIKDSFDTGRRGSVGRPLGGGPWGPSPIAE